MRAEAAGVSLTEGDASIIKGMLNRGDRQHDIAAWFGVNGGRIAEIANGDKFSDVPSAENNQLPPKGPYTTARAVEETRQKLTNMRDQLRTMIDDLDDQLSKLDNDRSA